jgi:predicted nucleic acid-binding protein
MVLVDTSIWVEVLRQGDGLDLESLVEFDEVVTCPPVVQEVLQGIRDPEAHAVAREAMLALPMLESPMPLAVYLEAAELYRVARRGGFTVRSSVDCLIAACAARHSIAVLHRDRDFDALAKVAAIDVQAG